MWPTYIEDNVPECCKSCERLFEGEQEDESYVAYCEGGIILPVEKRECRRHKPKEESENDRLKRLFS
jgi:hypothetical protein